MKKFKNKYRIESIRAQWWDYGWNGAYFLTICTQDRTHFLGKIENGQFIPSPIGQIAEQIWQQIPEHFPYADLEEFVVMPNHIHGILIIDKPMVDPRLIANPLIEDPPSPIPWTDPIKSGGFAGKKNPMLNDNVSRIVRWYKGRCTFEIRKIHADFAWQSLFYDHIIRDHLEYQRIEDYIKNNPANWLGD